MAGKYGLINWLKDQSIKIGDQNLEGCILQAAKVCKKCFYWENEPLFPIQFRGLIFRCVDLLMNN